MRDRRTFPSTNSPVNIVHVDGAVASSAKVFDASINSISNMKSENQDQICVVSRVDRRIYVTTRYIFSKYDGKTGMRRSSTSECLVLTIVPDYFHIWGGLNFRRKSVRFWSTKKSRVNGFSGRNESESLGISKKFPRNSCKFGRGQPPASPPSPVSLVLTLGKNHNISGRTALYSVDASLLAVDSSHRCRRWKSFTHPI